MNRQPAKRIFAAEFNDATYRFTDETKPGNPSMLLLPTGERAHRVWIAGTLVEASDIGNGEEYWQARIADTTGTFFSYARPGYQTNGVRALKSLDPPCDVTAIGRVHTYDPPDADDIYVSIEPEAIAPIDKHRKRMWGLETAISTRARIKAFNPETNPDDAEAASRYPNSGSDYFPLVTDALDAYGQQHSQTPATGTLSPSSA